MVIRLGHEASDAVHIRLENEPALVFADTPFRMDCGFDQETVDYLSSCSSSIYKVRRHVCPVCRGGSAIEIGTVSCRTKTLVHGHPTMAIGELRVSQS